MGMTKSLWPRSGANCVAFGAIDMRLTQATTEKRTISVEGREIKFGVHPERIAAAGRDTPLSRFGAPEEAAGSVYLLCIPESNYVTGQTLICGGGRGGF